MVLFLCKKSLQLSILLLFRTLGGLIYGAPSNMEICLMNTLQTGAQCSLKHWKWKLLSRVWLFMSHGLYSLWNSPGPNTGVGSCCLLQGIFPTQGLNPGLWVAEGFFTTEPPKPKNAVVGSLSLLQGIFLTQDLNQGLLHCRQILYQLSYQGRTSRYYVYSSLLCKLEGSRMISLESDRMQIVNSQT